MCGIAGIINFDNTPVEANVIETMTASMGHRGPDADGFFMEDGVAFGHRRLSIIDLSDVANQPFTENSGRYVIIFNGEIYNYAEIKLLLKEYEFRTGSDTEVLVAAYAKFGEACLGYFHGMFAFAIWDRKNKEIFIARDRMGVKPLYLSLRGSQLIFASEIRAILNSGLVKRKISQPALLEYFRFQSIGFPFSAIENIEQLEAGSWIRISKDKTEKKIYWDVTKPTVDFDFSNSEKVRNRIRELMLQSVKRRMVSDVPVGAFLSGGIDSSIIVGLMSQAGIKSPNTFNISFNEAEYDESEYAEIVAKKFNANHTKLLLHPEVFLDELQNALNAMDSPSGDGINTYVISKAIHSKGMKVALGGIGGDELFAGYPFFLQYLELQKRKILWKLPAFVRDRMSSVMLGSNKERKQQLIQISNCSISNVYPIFRQIISPKTLDELTYLSPSGFSKTALEQELENKKESLAKLPLLSQVSAAEYLGYTQQTLLKDTDQMSMSVSLEVREPYFDIDLVEFVMSVPDRLKKPIYPKSLLVESLKPLLPPEIVFRKKQGFLFPWNLWLKNELRSFCEERINNMTERHFINGKNLIEYWNRFLKGDDSIRWLEIWLFVILEYWMEKNNVE